MFTRIQARNYRCLRYVDQHLGPFHVLVGPNASGKSTFLDVIAFLGRLVSDGPEAAVEERTNNFHDLLWGRRGTAFELAVEARIPDTISRSRLRKQEVDTVRYEVAVSLSAQDQNIDILAETVLLKKADRPTSRHTELFPDWAPAPETILTPARNRSVHTVLRKVPGGNDNYYSETYKEAGKGWLPSFKLGPRRSALGNLPADESEFPVSTWLKDLLCSGVQQIVLNSQLIRRASPPGKGRSFRPDGSNLPWIIQDLMRSSSGHFERWVRHLKTTLPDLESIRVNVRDDDRNAYLMLGYRGGLEVPSWTVSDGTLRLLALTLPAYIADLSGVFLVEEPENGIHPQAVETLIQSLSSVYGAQMLLATHSPVILGLVEPNRVLCFAKADDGGTDIVCGDEHPALKHWRGETSLDILFAAGVLG